MKTTKKEFEEYKKWCLYYMDKFKLDDWDIYFELGNTEESIAHTNIKVYGRSVTFGLSDDIGELGRQTTFKESARHEVCHVLISELDALIATHVSEDEQTLANEKLTVKLARLLKVV